MKHSFSNVSLVAAIVVIAATSPGFTQSRHDRVSSDGSSAGSAEAAFSAGEAASATPARGASRVTEAALAAEGVFFEAESRTEFMRLAVLPDGGNNRATSTEVIIGPDTRERLYTSTYPSRAKVL